MLFFNKKPEKIENSVRERVETLEIRLKKCENEIFGLIAEQELLRNKVLRKIQFKRKKEEEDFEEEDTENAQNGLIKSKPLNTFSPFG